jgi:hypothetical protein
MGTASQTVAGLVVAALRGSSGSLDRVAGLLGGLPVQGQRMGLAIHWN